ncbi:MAG: hypothetical protein L6416_07080 [Candidatus Omnitrophica bacterium]|nr:hypothetical protein [Candidatus Omnitrophota bacterium]
MSREREKAKNDFNPAEIKIASQFAGNLFGMLKAVHLYPKGHQMLLQVLEKFFNYLNYILGEKQIATIRIFESKLYALDVCLPLDKPPGIESFIEELQKRFIRQITFNIGITITDITALIEVLNTAPEVLAKEGGARIKLAQGGARAAKLIEYYYRKHATIDQERLLTLSSSEIFRFFTDQIPALNAEQAAVLYDLLKEPVIISILLKVAAQYMLRDESCTLTESHLILNIISKIRASMTEHAISEEEEIQVILQDVVSSFEAEDLMSLIFDNPDNEMLNYTNAIDCLSKIVSQETTAQMITDKISKAYEENISIIEHIKKVFSRLFPDRKSFLSFLPIFKEKLQNSLDKRKVKEILNEVCDAFAPGLSFEDGEELAMGMISDLEFKDIEDGLNILKTVNLDKVELENDIREFSIDEARLSILKRLLAAESDLGNFKNILSKLVTLTENMLRQDRWGCGKTMFNFFKEQASSKSKVPQGYRHLIVENSQKLPTLLLEKLTINILFDSDADQMKKHFEELFLLLGEKLISLLVKIYAREENMPQAKLVREMILEHYTPNAFKMYVDLQKESAPNVLRVIDLLQPIKNEDTLPLLWDITFYENAMVAQRALKLIAAKNSDPALSMLLKTLEHPQLHMRIAGIEYLGSYRFKKGSEALVPIARGQINSNFDEAAVIDLRISALKSLLLLDSALAKTLLLELRAKKRWFIFPIEQKSLRAFAKDQLRNLDRK